MQIVFQTAHKCKLAECTEYKKSCDKKRPAATTAEQLATGSGLMPKRMHRQLTVDDKMLAVSVSQEKLDDLVMDNIIQQIRPLCTVEKPPFRKLVLQIGLSVMRQ